MLKLAAALFSFTALLYLGACGYLYANQRSLLYYPTPAAPAPGAERIALRSDGETLQILRAGPAQGSALIYFGGNAQDVSRLIPLFVKAFPGRSVYLVNYRGYGGSSGSPSEAALLRDAVTVFDFVRSRHPDVAVIGQSLGSGVAVFLATVRQIARLVLITPYDSIETVAKNSFPQFPVSLLLKDKFLSSTRAASVRSPTLILLAERDEVIPRASSDALIASFHWLRPVVEVVGGTTHDSVCAADACLKRLADFLHG
ncbi:alpha/beta fold hydrolase [Noviherbaspirillum sedimenti]|uniref:Alpha/beta fold hydrolase n=1 Tax=Noviherbaspirillum sedimenti TaxID=2320865 RepID=A0A3A3GAS4_9BURK|nr:alpha/beta fold hydrolase [Noviherbaspirillum sedimenti]RJG03869.1 alpha/beta fold hydrolase [Noviherbaspirillum sedimenti]